MRIIGGKYKGRRFLAPKYIDARPTTDFAKESLFNILNNKLDFDGLEVLDLFSGIGSISFEFLSRGAHVWSVEKNPKASNFISKQSQEWEFENHKVWQRNCYAFIPECVKQFDIIFADPPYYLNRYTELIELVFKHNLLKEDGILIVEHDKHTKVDDNEHYTNTRRYGHVHFSFFEKSNDNQA